MNKTQKSFKLSIKFVFRLSEFLPSKNDLRLGMGVRAKISARMPFSALDEA